MKDLLLNTYLKRQQDCIDIKNQFPEDDLAGPLLISPNVLYTKSPNPLLIVGQETKGWGYFSDNFEKQMDVYEEFNLGEEYYASPFWNVTRKVEKALGNLPYSCSWTNISKFDLEGGRSYGEYEAAISRLDDLLIDELEILKPKVCIFFSGPNFDYRLKKIFSSVGYQTVAEWPVRELAQLSHPMLPKLTFRTYHPRFLRMNGLEQNFIDFIKKISTQTGASLTRD